MFGLGIFTTFINNLRALNEEVVAMRQFFSEGNQRLRGEEPAQAIEEDDSRPKAAKKIAAKAG